MNAEVSQQFVGGCQSLHSSERNQTKSWKKNPSGAIKNEGVIYGQKVFGPQIVTACKFFYETPALSCHLFLLCLQDLSQGRVTNQEAFWSAYSWEFFCIIDIHYIPHLKKNTKGY